MALIVTVTHGNGRHSAPSIGLRGSLIVTTTNLSSKPAGVTDGALEIWQDDPDTITSKAGTLQLLASSVDCNSETDLLCVGL